jgi:hypothetical protein
MERFRASMASFGGRTGPSMPTAEWFRRKADEHVALAKAAVSNEDRARNYGIADHYFRLSRDEPGRSKSPVKQSSRPLVKRERVARSA